MPHEPQVPHNLVLRPGSWVKFWSETGVDIPMLDQTGRKRLGLQHLEPGICEWIRVIRIKPGFVMGVVDHVTERGFVPGIVYMLLTPLHIEEHRI